MALTGSPSAVVTGGYGTFSSASLLITRGYGAGEAVSVTPILFMAQARSLTFEAQTRDLVFVAKAQP